MAVMGPTLSEVEATVAAGDPKSIRAAAHNAKGEAQYVVATSLGRSVKHLGDLVGDFHKRGVAIRRHQ